MNIDEKLENADWLKKRPGEKGKAFGNMSILESRLRLEKLLEDIRENNLGADGRWSGVHYLTDLERRILIKIIEERFAG